MAACLFALLVYYDRDHFDYDDGQGEDDDSMKRNSTIKGFLIRQTLYYFVQLTTCHHHETSQRWRGIKLDKGLISVRHSFCSSALTAIRYSQ